MKGAPCVLVVEDSAAHLARLRQALLPLCGVMDAASRADCLAAMAERRFCAVVLNHSQGNAATAIETLREIVRHDPATAVLFVTDCGNEDLAVEAIKSGATDYIRKTLNHGHLPRVIDNVRRAIAAQHDHHPNGIKQDVLKYFEEQRQTFLKRWRDQIALEQERIGLDGAAPVNEVNIERLYSAFLEDIRNDHAAATLAFLRQLVSPEQVSDRSLVAIELVNMSFKDVARQMLVERFPDSFDSRAMLMGRISMIVDENDLRLSVEYERLIGEAVEQMRQADRMSVKSMLLTTLQHEIRQSLSYVMNTAELMLRNREQVGESAIWQIIDQVRRVENLLAQLERDTQLRTARYADHVDMIAVPAAGAPKDQADA